MIKRCNGHLVDCSLYNIDIKYFESHNFKGQNSTWVVMSLVGLEFMSVQSCHSFSIKKNVSKYVFLEGTTSLA